MIFYLLIDNLFIREGIRAILSGKYAHSAVKVLKDIDNLNIDEIKDNAIFICNNPLTYYNFQPKISNLSYKKNLKTILLANSRQINQLKSKDIHSIDAVIYTNCSLTDLNEALTYIQSGKKYRCKRLNLTETNEIDFITYLVNQKVSYRELEVVKLVLDGLNSKDIAKKLNISYNTVTTHRRNINKKLGLRGPNDLIRLSVSKFTKDIESSKEWIKTIS